MSFEFFVACLLPEGHTQPHVTTHDDVKSVLYEPLVRFNKARSSITILDEPDVLLHPKSRDASEDAQKEIVIRLFHITIDDRSGKIGALINGKHMEILPPLRDEDDEENSAEEKDDEGEESGESGSNKKKESQTSSGSLNSASTRPVFALLATKLQSTAEWATLFTLSNIQNEDVAVVQEEEQEEVVVTVTCPFDPTHQVIREEILAHLTEFHVSECVSFVGDWAEAKLPSVVEVVEQRRAAAAAQIVSQAAADAKATEDGKKSRKRNRSSEGGKKHRSKKSRRHHSDSSGSSSSSSESEGSSDGSARRHKNRHHHLSTADIVVDNMQHDAATTGAPPTYGAPAGQRAPPPPSPGCNTLHVFCSDPDVDPVWLAHYFMSVVAQGEDVLQVVYHPTQRCTFVQFESGNTAIRLLEALFPSQRVGSKNLTFRWASRWVPAAPDHPRDSAGRYMTQVFRGRALMSSIAHNPHAIHSHHQTVTAPPAAPPASLPPSYSSVPAAPQFGGGRTNAAFPSIPSGNNTHYPATAAPSPVNNNVNPHLPRSQLSGSSMIILLPTAVFRLVPLAELERTAFFEIIRLSNNVLPGYIAVTHERIIVDMKSVEHARVVMEAVSTVGSRYFSHCMSARMSIN